MTDEERRIISAFVERISGAAPVPQPVTSPWGAAAAPQRPALPPIDPEADQFIGELFARYPEARYRLTQTAFVQEAALHEATNRIQQLEWEVENARRQGQAQAAQAGGGGMLGGLFGGRSNAPMPPPMPPRPQPQYPAGYNPQALAPQQGRGGMGFLGTAASAAAGVAGGMLLGNMLMSAFSGAGGAAQAAASPFETGGADASPASSPWTDPAAAAAPPADSGGWAQQDATPVDDAWSQQDASADTGGDWGGDEEV
jgi:hypothetical protein